MRHLALLPLSLVPVGLINLALTRALASFLEARGLFSAENMVRGHLLVGLSALILVATSLIHVTAGAQYRRRLLLKALRAAFFVLSLALLLSLESLIDEGSLTTFATAVVLACAAGMASLCGRHRGTGSPADQAKWNLFWGGLACAFGFAALDEILMIHESIGLHLRTRWSSIEWLQRVDLMTGVYAVGAITFVLASYLLFKPVFRRTSRYVAAVLLSGAVVFAAAAFVDSGAFLFEGLGTWTDFNLLSSAVEEALELLAATLFLVAVSIAFLDQQEPPVRIGLLGIDKAGSPAGGLPVTFIVPLTLYLLGLAALLALHQPDNSAVLVDNRGFEVEVLAGPSEGLMAARSVAVTDTAVYVANENGSTVALNRGSDSSVATVSAVELGEVADLAVSEDGTLFLSDDDRFAVLEIKHGSETRVLVTRREGLRGAKGLTLGPDGLLYIADGNSSAIFRLDGSRLSHVASSLHGLVAPRDLAFDGAGDLYATDDARNRIFRIGRDGTVVILPPSNLVPASIAARGDCVVVIDRARGAVVGLDGDGRSSRLATFAQRYGNLLGVAVDQSGSILVVSSNRPPLPSYLFKLVSKDPTMTACGKVAGS